MPSCKNGKGSYKGTEPSPKGRGYCARHEKVGTKKRGKDKKMWQVRSIKLASGKRSKRWFKVLPKAKPTKPIKPIKRKVSTKKKKTHQEASRRRICLWKISDWKIVHVYIRSERQGARHTGPCRNR